MEVPPNPKPRRRGPPVVVLVPIVLACVIVPYLFWQGTWFGKPLSAEDIEARLIAIEPAAGGDAEIADAKLRQAQHAFEQISKMITRRSQGDAVDPTVFYPKLVALAGHPSSQIRGPLAWVMGEDNQEPSFAAPLRKLVTDDVALVRHNAALALARRGDKEALPALRQMLQPLEVEATAAGKVVAILDPGVRISKSNELVRVESGGTVATIRAPITGELERRLVAKGDEVAKGQVLCTLLPGNQQVYFALRCMTVLADDSDLQLVRGFIDRKGYGQQVWRQAKEAVAAIEKRAK